MADRTERGGDTLDRVITRRGFLATLAGSSLALAAAQASVATAPAVASPAAQAQPEDPYTAYVAELEAAAAAEGKLVIYSTSTVEPGQHTDGDRMRKTYPWLEIEEVLESSGSRLLERMLLEIQAGRSPDIADLGSGQMGDLRQKGLLAEYRTPLEDKYVPGYTPKHHFWTASTFRSLHNIYNTNLISADQIGNAYELLLEPKWKGLTGIDIGGSFYQMWTALEIRRGEDQAREFMRQFGTNEPRPYFSNSQIRNLVAAGELAFGILIYLDNILTMQRQGAPIGIWNPDPVVFFPSVSGILQAAPHPGAARLFVEWNLRPEVQRELALEQVVAPGRADVENPYPQYFQDVPFVVAGPDETEPRLEAQRKDYEQFFRVAPIR